MRTLAGVKYPTMLLNGLDRENIPQHPLMIYDDKSDKTIQREEKK
jgi:hypothetical protein